MDQEQQKVRGRLQIAAAIDRQPLWVTPETSLIEVIKLTSQNFRICPLESQSSVADLASLMPPRKSCVLVKAGEQLVGILTERDVVKWTAQGLSLSAVKAADVMTQNLKTLQESDLQNAFKILAFFQQYRIRHLPVLNSQGQVVGVVTPNSIRQVLQPTDLLNLRRVEEVMTTHVIWALPTATIMGLAQLMAHHRVSCVVIVEPDESVDAARPHPVGIVTEWDIVQFQALELDLMTLRAHTVMSTPLICLHPQDALWKAHQTMQRLHVRRLVITNNRDELVGVLTQTSFFSVLNPLEMYHSIQILQQQVNLLRDEKIELLQTLNSNLESQIEYCEQRFQATFEQAAVGIAHVSFEGRFLHINQWLCNLMGYGRDELLKKRYLDIIYPDDRERVWAFIEQLIRREIPSFSREKRVCLNDGSSMWVNVTVSIVSQADAKRNYLVAVIEDISDRKKIEADRQRVELELFEEKELAQVTLHSIGDAVITTDAVGRVQYCNPVAERLTGWEATVAKGRPLHEVFRIINETTRDPTENPVTRVLREGCIVGLANHTLLITRDGNERSIDDSAAPIRNRDGHVIGAVLVFHDVTEARTLARQLSWQASHDALTGLVNRRQFEQELRESLRGAKFNNQQHVLCYLDLDQFKVVNDTSGHMAGDELLRQVAMVLKARIRGADVLARLGGDEFAILLKQCPLEQAEAIAKTLQDAIQAFRFVWQDKTFRIAMSIGLVPLMATSRDLISVMSAADAACYAAKIRGRNRVHVYQTDDSELVRQRHEQQWSIRIREALEENRFCLYRQAVVPTTEHCSSQKTHYEILLRMIDETGTLVLPTVFIPAAERYGLMQQIDHWVIQTFLAQIEQSRPETAAAAKGAATIPYMINLSGASLSDDQFLSFLRTQFTQYPTAPQFICFEITETAAISNLNQAIHFIHELKQLGCQFALDDFWQRDVFFWLPQDAASGLCENRRQVY